MCTKTKTGLLPLLALAMSLTIGACKETGEDIPHPITQGTEIAKADSRISISLRDERGANLLSLESNRDALSVLGMASGTSVRSSYEDKQGVMIVTLDEFDHTLGLEAPQSPFVISYKGEDLQGFCSYYHAPVPKELKPYVMGSPLRIKSITIGRETITLPEGKDPLKDQVIIPLRYAGGKLSVVK